MEDKKKINENVVIIILKKERVKTNDIQEQIESYIKTIIEYMEQLKLFFLKHFRKR